MPFQKTTKINVIFSFEKFYKSWCLDCLFKCVTDGATRLHHIGILYCI